MTRTGVLATPLRHARTRPSMLTPGALMNTQLSPASMRTTVRTPSVLVELLSTGMIELAVPTKARGRAMNRTHEAETSSRRAPPPPTVLERPC